MPAMRAYLDDFGSITIWMEKNFYGGKSDSFFLVAEDGYMKELVVKKLVEHDARVKYEMTCPSDLPFGKDYKVREIHGLSTCMMNLSGSTGSIRVPSLLLRLLSRML